jgi:hypothetical protein
MTANKGAERLSMWGPTSYNRAVKYDIQPGQGNTVRVALTTSGRVQEFLWGGGVAALWVVVALGVIFAPDYIFRFSGEAADTRFAIWITGGAIVAGFAAYFGFRRGIATRAWEFDREVGVVRRYARTLTLAPIVDLEIPLDAVRPGGDERDVSIELPGGTVYVIARRPGDAQHAVIAKAVFGGTE